MAHRDDRDVQAATQDEFIQMLRDAQAETGTDRARLTPLTEGVALVTFDPPPAPTRD